MKRSVVLYDADCGLCRWGLAKILSFDRRNRLRPVALQDPEADRLVPGMDAVRKWASWHLVDPEGSIRSAGDAVAPLLHMIPGGRPLAALSSTFPRFTDRLYRWIADHRDGLGRLLGARACSVRTRARQPPPDRPGPTLRY